MRRLLVAFVLTLTPLVTVCSPDADPLATPDQRGQPLSVQVESDPQAIPLDPLDVLDAHVSGDTLTVDLRFSGGCAHHDIALVWSGAFMESHPVQTLLVLAHDDNDDPCDSVVTEVRRFHLSPLKASYRASYRTQSGAIILHLEGLGESLLYEF